MTSNRELEMRDALASVAHAINAMGSTKDRQDAVTTWWLRLHRTLQQQFVLTVVLPVLRQLAEDHETGHTDLRNMAAGQLARKMLSNISAADTYLPLI